MYSFCAAERDKLKGLTPVNQRDLSVLCQILNLKKVIYTCLCRAALLPLLSHMKLGIVFILVSLFSCAHASLAYTSLAFMQTRCMQKRILL